MNTITKLNRDAVAAALDEVERNLHDQSTHALAALACIGTFGLTADEVYPRDINRANSILGALGR